MLGRVLAVDVDEANRATNRRYELSWRHRPAVALVYDNAAEPHLMCDTVSLKASKDPGIRPTETVDRQCPLSITYA